MQVIFVSGPSCAILNNTIYTTRPFITVLKATWSVCGFLFLLQNHVSISYNYCSILTANKCFIETELTL